MTSTRGSTAYLRGLIDLLDRLDRDQGPQIEQAAAVMAATITRGGLVHLFGSGHSMLPALEIFPRYGSFVGLHPVIDPRLFWFNVLGSFGVPEMLFLQNTEGYAEVAPARSSSMPPDTPSAGTSPSSRCRPPSPPAPLRGIAPAKNSPTWPTWSSTRTPHPEKRWSTSTGSPNRSARPPRCSPPPPASPPSCGPPSC